MDSLRGNIGRNAFPRRDRGIPTDPSGSSTLDITVARVRSVGASRGCGRAAGPLQFRRTDIGRSATSLDSNRRGADLARPARTHRAAHPGYPSPITAPTNKKTLTVHGGTEGFMASEMIGDVEKAPTPPGGMRGS